MYKDTHREAALSTSGDLGPEWLIHRLLAGTSASRAAFAARFCLGESDHIRKEWIANRLEDVAEIFAVAVGGFLVMNIGPSHAKPLSRKSSEETHGRSEASDLDELK
jgi:hypothetical protein